MKPYDPGRNLYALYRKTPPTRAHGHGSYHGMCYYDGFEGRPCKAARGSIGHWAWKAGRDAKKSVGYFVETFHPEDTSK
jgi:hypothetical protein